MHAHMNRRSFLNFAAGLIAAACLAHGQQLSFTPFHASGIYDPGEKAGWKVALSPGAESPVGKYGYVIRKNNLDTIATGTLDLSQGDATIEIGLNEPAMVYVEVNAPGGAVHLGAAIAPSQLKPAVPRPADSAFGTRS